MQYVPSLVKLPLVWLYYIRRGPTVYPFCCALDVILLSKTVLSSLNFCWASGV